MSSINAKSISITLAINVVCFADNNDVVTGFTCSNNNIFAVDNGQGFIIRIFEYTPVAFVLLEFESMTSHCVISPTVYLPSLPM